MERGIAAEEHLRGLGFTQHEAAVYVFLLRHPLSTGYEVAKGSGLPRGNVYQVLETLARRGAAQALSVEPVRYAATPPARLLAAARHEVEQRYDAALEALREIETPADVELFYTLRGADQVRTRLIDMVNATHRRAVLSLWAADLPPLAMALRQAQQRGAAVVLNVFGDDEAPRTNGESGRVDGDSSVFRPSSLPEGVQVYWHEPADKTVGGHLIFAAVDDAQALAATLDEPASGVYTQNATLVRLVEKLVRDESYLAEIFAEFQPQLEARYGPHLVHLRRRLLPQDQAERLLTVVAFGRHGLDVRDGAAAQALLEAAAR